MPGRGPAGVLGRNAADASPVIALDRPCTAEPPTYQVGA